MTQAISLPSADQIQKSAEVSQHVFESAFLRRMAQHGYTADTAADAQALFAVGRKVAAAVESATESTTSKYASAAQAFDSLGGQTASYKAASADAQEVALALLQDPDVYQAALTANLTNLQ